MLLVDRLEEENRFFFVFGDVLEALVMGFFVAAFGPVIPKIILIGHPEDHLMEMGLAHILREIGFREVTDLGEIEDLVLAQ